MNASLIITTYNWDKALRLTLQSVVAQSVFPSEILIADDGSGEETRKVISEISQKSPIPIKHIWHEDEGFRASVIRNKAIAEATSEYIILLDGDMVVHKDFIKDHISYAKTGYFVQGSRVLLNQPLTKELIEKESFIRPHFFSPAIKNKLNTLRSKGLRSLFGGNKLNIGGIRSCNFAFWKKDFISVNGFNEDITGWGREDSELATRLVNAGIYRQNIKFSAVGYHLHHNENSRDRLDKNDTILNNTISGKLKFCNNGINKYIKTI